MVMTINNTFIDPEPRVFSDQNQQFWTLQISGWLGYALVVFMAIIRPQFDDPDFNLEGQIINLLIETISGFVFSYLLWIFIRAVVQRFSLKKTLILSFSAAALMGIIFNVIKLASYKTVVYHQVWYQQWNMLEFGGWFLFSVSTLFIWTAIFFIMLYNTKLQKEHEMLLRAQTAAKDAQLRMMRYQLNPHFMFNTINAISTLIYKKDNEKAAEMLEKLSDFFRYSLTEKTAVNSSLDRELELLNVYLDIEKVRFGDRLSVITSIDPLTLHAQVPSLFLQPIIENAIKYSVEMNKKQAIIEVKTQRIQQRLFIHVIDNGIGNKSTTNHGFGIGLNNTKERLSTMFNHDFQLDFLQDEHGTQVKINLPFVKVKSSANR